MKLALENEDPTSGGVIYASSIGDEIPYDLFDGENLKFMGEIDRSQLDTASKKVAIEITASCK